MSGLRLRRVRSLRDHNMVQALQRLILPCDTPVDTRKGVWWLLWDDDYPCAFAGLTPSAQWTDTGYLCRAGVLLEYRGRGLQRRLVQVREREARRRGWTWLVSDTRNNFASANTLIRCGFTLYQPSQPWGFKDTLYWKKQVQR